MGVTAGQPGVAACPIAGFDPPASIQQFYIADKAASPLIAVLPSEPDQRQHDAGEESGLGPERHGGNDDGDAGQQMTDTAADEQKP